MGNNDFKILVVDDEEKIAEVIKSYLEKDGFSVITSFNGKEALDCFEKNNPDLIILDLMLPDISGEEICRKIRDTSAVPIIMLTAKVEEDFILNGLNIGADDYVTKPFSPRQLVARVNAVLRRVPQKDKSEDILQFNNGDLVINLENHDIKKNNKYISLTPVEYEILVRLAKHPKKVFTREELIAFALGEDYEGFDRTIDTHVKNLRQKIESNTKDPQYIMTVYGLGYKFGGE